MFKFLVIFLINFLTVSSNISAKTVLDVIAQNENLTVFHSYLKKTGLDKVLQKNLPWNWTIFAPSNLAFDNANQELKSEILKDEFLTKNIFMDHIMTGHKTSLDVDDKITTQLTVSNKPLQLYKSNKLHVKDMVVVQENLIGGNGVVHVIDCIMFVQPSSEDDRVSDDIAATKPITSCCMHNQNEIRLFINGARNKF